MFEQHGVRRALCVATIILVALPTVGAGSPRPAAGVSAAQEQIPAERLEARTWYQDAKFGMFVHWGVYSMLGAGEWVMNNRNIEVDDYEWLASTFNPVDFDAAAWVGLAKAAGMKYITITSRHHDGFSMFESEASPYNIVDWTAFGRDPLMELAEECRRQELKLFFYYSQLDWRRSDYFPRGRTGLGTGRPDEGDWDDYIAFMDAQLTELLTNYGPIGGIWFDGMWDKPDADWHLEPTYSLIHRLQPAALIIPNHHELPRPGEDVQTFEQDLPGANTAGFNTTAIGALPIETSLTINGSWGFNITDDDHKSVPELIGYLVRAAGYGANLLLNVGPRPDGTIDAVSGERLRAMGEWLAVYGPSIYETRGGPITPRDWGATTQRGDTVYVHVLEWPDRVLSIPTLPGSVRSAEMLVTGEVVTFVESPEGISLTLPPRRPGEHDQVVVVEVARRD